MRALAGLLVLTTTLLAACSGVQLAYRNADLLIGSYAEDLLDLGDEQRQRWEPLLDAGLREHRETELPALVALLQGLEIGAARGFTEAGLGCLRDTAWARWRATAAMLAEASAPLLAELSPAQVRHLRERLRERNEEYRDEHLSADPAERHEARVTRLVKRIERWTGRLGAAQRALVARHVASWPPLAQGWHDYRGAQQARLLAMIESGADRERLRRFLLGWWAEQADMPAALRADRSVVERDMLRLFVELQATLGGEQVDHLVEEFGALRRSLAALLDEDSVEAAVAGLHCDPGAGAAVT